MLSLGKFVIALEYFKHTLIYFFIINILKDYYQQVERNVFLLKHLQIPRGKFFFFQHACAHTQHLLGKILYEIVSKSKNKNTNKYSSNCKIIYS